jgi:hypothetical protein
MPFNLLHTALRKPLQEVDFFLRRSTVYEIVDGKGSEGSSDVTYRLTLNPQTAVLIFVETTAPCPAVSSSNNARAE